MLLLFPNTEREVTRAPELVEGRGCFCLSIVKAF